MYIYTYKHKVGWRGVCTYTRGVYTPDVYACTPVHTQYVCICKSGRHLGALARMYTHGHACANLRTHAHRLCRSLTLSLPLACARAFSLSLFISAAFLCTPAYTHMHNPIFTHPYTHTGIRIFCQQGRSQLHNKELAYVFLNYTLQHTKMHCNALQHIATHCNTLQHAATHCNTLQHTATHCIPLQHSAAAHEEFAKVLYSALCSNTLQHTAARCKTLQHTATHCNTLQHTAIHCNTLQRFLQQHKDTDTDTKTELIQTQT